MPIFESAASIHSTQPMYQNPNLCYTAEIANGVLTGGMLAANQQHFMHYRYGGCCHWSQCNYGIAAPPDPCVHYIIIHHPARRNSGKQRLALFVKLSAVADWSVGWADGFADASFTTLWSGTADYSEIKKQGIISYTTPTGTGANSMTVVKLEFTGCYPISVNAHHVGDLVIPALQYLVPEKGCSTGKVIAAAKNSYVGLLNGIGTGADDVESMERLTRRTFFNQCHPEGSHCGDDTGANYVNMLTEHQYHAKCRNLTGLGGEHFCYPAAILIANNHSAVDCEVQVSFHNNNLDDDRWTYTLQPGDADGTPIFVHPWSGAGSSSTDGLPVSAANMDYITVEGYVDFPGGGTAADLYLLAWALFEGPAY